MPSLDLANLTLEDQNMARLISQVARGNESSLSELYDSTSRFVYGLAFHILADVAEAEEVTIDVYMQVWKKAVEYDPKRSKPIAWLFMLTRSRAIDRLRSSSKRTKLEDSLDTDIPNSDTDPEEATLVVERSNQIRNALSKLTPQQRKAIELAYFNGLSQSEIAARLNQPIGTVKSWMRLGMLKLRELLGVLNEEK
ncbi:MAG TPA: sigma-70 family RNA polymerase sigma factor [Thermodesulfobacteriota bacterium]